MGRATHAGRVAAPARPAASGRRAAGGDAAARDAAAVEVEYFTDPLCCWSWAMEPQWRRLRYEFGGRLCWRYRMGGMIHDWSSFSDPLNDVAAPAHMGRHWYQLRRTAGISLDERLWVDDPPKSSYPASLAVKAAELQGGRIGEAYLRRVREAAALERRNIGRWDVLLAIAEELHGAPGPGSGFDVERFLRALSGEEAREAFRDDLRETRFREIGRFPTLVLRRAGDDRGLVLVGCRPYEGLRAALAEVAPDLGPPRVPRDVLEYVGHWDTVTAADIAVGLELDPDAAAAALAGHAARGMLVRSAAGSAFRNRCPALAALAPA